MQVCPPESDTDPYVAAARAAGTRVHYLRRDFGDHGFGLKPFWAEPCAQWLRGLGVGTSDAGESGSAAAAAGGAAHNGAACEGCNAAAGEAGSPDGSSNGGAMSSRIVHLKQPPKFGNPARDTSEIHPRPPKGVSLAAAPSAAPSAAPPVPPPASAAAAPPPSAALPRAHPTANAPTTAPADPAAWRRPGAAKALTTPPKVPSLPSARLQRERKENLRRKVFNREWRFLSDVERGYARQLGFTGESGWNNDDEHGWAQTPAWEAMGEEERQAALRLQFSAESWRGPPPWLALARAAN